MAEQDSGSSAELSFHDDEEEIPGGIHLVKIIIVLGYFLCTYGT
jgi:hypothetical protein